MHGKAGVVAEVTESLCQKTKVTVPEKLVGADGEDGVEKDFQSEESIKKRWALICKFRRF